MAPDWHDDLQAIAHKLDLLDVHLAHMNSQLLTISELLVVIGATEEERPALKTAMLERWQSSDPASS